MGKMEFLKRIFKRKPKINPIKIAGIYNIYFKLGCPREIGSKIEVQMRSGKIGIYKLSKIESGWNVDWNWYIFNFSHYKKESEPVYPKYC